MKLLSRVLLFAIPWTVAYQVPPSMEFPGKNTGVGCHFLLQEIFLIQGLNPDLPHYRQMLYHLSYLFSLGKYKKELANDRQCRTKPNMKNNSVAWQACFKMSTTHCQYFPLPWVLMNVHDCFGNYPFISLCFSFLILRRLQPMGSQRVGHDLVTKQQ